MIVSVPMSAEARSEVVAFVYHRWAEAVDQERVANEMVYNPRVHGDHDSFEMTRAYAVAHAAGVLERWSRILDSVKSYDPLIRGE